MSELRSHRDTWTVTLGPEAAGPETVLVAPPHVSLEAGFARLRRLLAETPPERPIRFIAPCATVRHRWPKWLAGVEHRVFLSELDGYFPRDKGPVVAQLVPTFNAWLDRLLEGVAPGVPPSVAFISTANERWLFQLTEAWMFAISLHELHPHDQILSVDPLWNGLRFLHARRSPSEIAPRRHRRLVTAGALLGMAGASVLRRLRSFVAEAPARKKLRELRARGDGSQPRLWMAVLGHWPRMSRPAIDVVPPLASEAREPLGVLLQESLSTRVQTSLFWGQAEERAMFPTLDGLEVAAVDQGVSAETFGELARAIGESLALSARAAFRALRTELALPVGDRTVAVDVPPLPLAKLLVYDVMRAREAYRASQALLARRRFDGSVVVWSHATAVNDVITDRLTQAAGAESLELVHGISEIQHQLGPGASSTSMKALWTQPEATALIPLRPGQRCVGGYLPRPLPAPVVRAPLARGEPIRVLLVSAYVVSAFGLDVRLYEPYLEPLLQEVLDAQHAGLPIEVRWRPHPGDDPARIARVGERFPFERSTGELDDDLRWCRLVASCVSSVALEALLYDVPLFIHDIARWDESTMSLFDPERVFGRQRTLTSVLGRCIEQLRAGDPKALAPEQALRRRAFGPSGHPLSISELLWPAGAAQLARAR